MHRKKQPTNPLEPLIFQDAFSDVARSSRRMLPINIQLFANGGAGDNGDNGGDKNENGGNDNSEGNDDNSGGNDNTGDTGDNGGDNEKNGADDGEKNDDDDINKIVQSRVDRGLAAARKTISDLKGEVRELQQKLYTADELKKLDDDEREQKLADKERELTEKENRFTAITALREVGLDDGSKTALLLVDFLIAGENTDSETIKDRAKTLNTLITKRVAAEVEKKFKENGRNPKGSGNSSGGDDKNTSVAKKLGEARAAQDKRSQEILKQYGI